MIAAEFKNLTFRYAETDAYILKNADFELHYGEVALLSGLSGEGKSTVLSLLSGIIPNVTPGEIEGELRINGESIKDKRMQEICRSVGVVLQNAQSQIVHPMVEDELAFGCENFAFPKDKIAENITTACKAMQLSPAWRTRTLSGGQKQRLITAATLATGQKILLLDEPLANLDRGGGHLLMTTLRKLALEGYAVLLIEHRLDVVLPYVDTVWCIEHKQTHRVEDVQSYLKAQTMQIEGDSAKQTDGTNILSLNHVQYKAGQRVILKNISLDEMQGYRRVVQKGRRGVSGPELPAFHDDCARRSGVRGEVAGICRRNARYIQPAPARRAPPAFALGGAEAPCVYRRRGGSRTGGTPARRAACGA